MRNLLLKTDACHRIAAQCLIDLTDENVVADSVTLTRRNEHSLEMQIGADSPTLTLTLTLDLLNPKSIGFDTMSRTTTVPSIKSLRSGVVS